MNVTLCFTAGQALLAAKAGAKFISPFVGRLDDIGQDGMGLIEKFVAFMLIMILIPKFWWHRSETSHVVDAALMGADVVTLPPKF